VAFECKYCNRPVEKSKITDFDFKLKDSGIQKGVFLSKNGFQEGAMVVAKYCGIKTVNIKDLPGLNNILAGRIKTLFLPDKNQIGEPFWTIMELKNGAITGNYHMLKNNNRNIVSLFFSKQSAEIFTKELQLKKSDWHVTGLSQNQLKSFLIMFEDFENKGDILQLIFEKKLNETEQYVARISKIQDIDREFCIKVDK
jgi:hypothetical protein